MKILLVEDDKKITNLISKGLRAEGFTVDTAKDGQEGFFLSMDRPYDLIVLDLILPYVDGLEILRGIRKNGSKIPVIILSAKESVNDRVKGLSEGADDYMIKPFAIAELVARVKALMRRETFRTSETILEIANLKMDLVKREVTRNNQAIDLTTKEFSLLEYLIRHRGQPVTRNMIAENVWEQHFDTFTNVIDVYVRYLRKKVDQDYSPRLIHTVRGVGYMVDIKE